METRSLRRNATLLAIVLSMAMLAAPGFGLAWDGDGRGPRGDRGFECPGFSKGPGGCFGKGRGGRGGGVMGIWRNPEMAEALALTDAQTEKLKDAHFAHREKMLELDSQKEKHELELEKEMSADAVDEARVKEVAKKIADIKGKMYMERIEARLTAEKILTADQLEKLRSERMKRWEKRKERKGRDYGRHGRRDRGEPDKQ